MGAIHYEFSAADHSRAHCAQRCEHAMKGCLSARKRTRTSTGLPQLGPEPSASTNSAIRAMPTTGLEPVRHFWHWHLKPACLPISACGRNVHNHGAEGSRTPYLLNAIQALSQLSYSPNTTRIFKEQSGKPGSNRRPSRWQRDALPTELFPRTGLTGLEPATSAVTVRHSNQAELQPLQPTRQPTYPHGDSNPGRCAENAES